MGESSDKHRSIFSNRIADCVFACGLLVSETPPTEDKEENVHWQVDEELSRLFISRPQTSRSRHVSATEPALLSPNPGASDLTEAKGVRHPLDQRYRAQLFFRYPANDSHQKVAADKFLPSFCFPVGLQLKHDSQKSPQPSYHSFVITDELGVKNYVNCITIYEPLTPNEQLAVQEQLQLYSSATITDSDREYISHIQQKLDQELQAISTVAGEETDSIRERIHLYRDLLQPYQRAWMKAADFYKPKCIGILGRWPFYSFFRDWLYGVTTQLLDGKLVAPIERYITQIIQEVPLPPPGKIRVSLPLGDVNLLLFRPPLNCVNNIKGFSLYPLFATLGIDDIILIFEQILSEGKILLVSQHLGLLNHVTEALSLFMFPLYWQHVFIPVLPASMWNFIHAPVPFLIGAHSDCKSIELIPSDVSNSFEILKIGFKSCRFCSLILICTMYGSCQTGCVLP